MKTTLLFLCFVASCGTGPAPNAEADPALVAARRTLSDYRDLFRLILTKAGEDPNQELVLGEPIDIYSVDVAALAASPSGMEPVLRDTTERLFPIHNRSGAVLTSLTLARAQDGWRYTNAGSKNLTTRLVAARAQLGPDGSTARLVRIRSLGVELLATGAGAATLVPLSDRAALDLRAAQPEPASALVPRLALAARAALSRRTDL